MSIGQNLMPEPPETLLPEDPEADEAVAAARHADDVDAALREVAAQRPALCAAWAALAERALDADEAIPAYAYARTGYHRGLDQLRRNGWKGHGPIPWSHHPNRGVLRSINALGRAAAAIGEADEAARCAQLLRDSDPQAADALS